MIWMIDPPPLLRHVRRGSPRQLPRAADVHVEGALPGVERVGERRRDPGERGVVHEHVQARGLRQHLIGQRLDRRRLPEIDRERPGAPPERLDLARDRLAVLALARGDEDVGAGLGEAQRDRAPESAPAAGHERAATREIEELLDPHRTSWRRRSAQRSSTSQPRASRRVCAAASRSIESGSTRCAFLLAPEQPFTPRADTPCHRGRRWDRRGSRSARSARRRDRTP